MRLPLSRSFMVILAALALLVAPAAAQAKTPKKTVIAKVLKKAYCGPIKAANGNTVAIATVTLKSVKRGARRPGPVFPVRVRWSCDYHATPRANPGDFADDLRIRGRYLFYRDQFGSWTHRNTSHTVRSVDGTN